MLLGNLMNQIVNLLGCLIVNEDSLGSAVGFGRKTEVVDKLINLFGIGINLLAIFPGYSDNFLGLDGVFPSENQH